MEARVDRKYPLVNPSDEGTATAFILLMKPGIVAAVLLAGFTGMVLGGRGWPDATTGLACLSTLFLAATGSAMLNGVLEASLDSRMVRLRARRAALESAGRMPVLAAALAGIAAALILALCCLNSLAFILILAAVLSYTLFYTLLFKRCSPWGVVPGGVPGALPILVGQAAVSGSITWEGLLFFCIMLLWQPPHFWLLALRHQDDYRAAGVPVLPVVRGEVYTKILIFLYAAPLLPASLALWLFGLCSSLYAACALTLWMFFLSACYRHMVRSRRFDRAFRASVIYLVMLLMALILDISLVERAFAAVLPGSPDSACDLLGKLGKLAL